MNVQQIANDAVERHVPPHPPVREGDITEIRDQMDKLRGRLFQAIEAWGPGRKREEAMKGQVRTITYHFQANLEAMTREDS